MTDEPLQMCVSCDEMVCWLRSRHGPRKLKNLHFDTLLHSASECFICRFLYDRVMTQGIRYGGKNSRICVDCEGGGGDHGQLSVYMEDIGSASHAHAVAHLRIQLDFSPGNIASLLRHCGSKSDTVSDKIKMMKAWYEECNTKHEGCRPRTRIPPKRLIYLGAAMKEHNVDLRLVISKEIPKDFARYATLSHCWGGDQPLKSTMASYTKFRGKIKLSDLPQTFRDVVVISRGVGLDYLWIDSKAAHSPLQLWTRLTLPGDVSLCPVPTDFYQTRHTLFIALNWASPSCTRGWALQEKILSPRVLNCWTRWPHFNFLCQTHRVEEIRDISSSTSASGHSREEQLKLSADTPLSNYIWWRWVQDYSQRQISFEKDRLPAIAGITSHYAEAVDDTPVLGLWEKTLIWDLHWSSYEEHLRPSCTGKGRIATWSWLSHARPVLGPHDMFLFLRRNIHNFQVSAVATVNTWNVAWEGLPMTSTLKMAYLIITGPVKPYRFPKWEILDKHPVECKDSLFEKSSLDRIPDTKAEHLNFHLYTTPVIKLNAWNRTAWDCFLILGPCRRSKASERLHKILPIIQSTSELEWALYNQQRLISLELQLRLSGWGDL
ncbi:hypothetical protein EJ08DRAFT_351614 [Tothia fuscella]|uniref:Heterokaryon incompatibility domain-containing protein n=1 Tax=Tothia fuscella TaxID=1048955 RepID=A0A9P4NMM5_9PEZI|nr:hypothetical protein EJ08DRAFT_351614 [Tothia fuscella]